MASQYMLGNLNFTKDTIWVMAQTDSIHETQKTSMFWMKAR